MQAVSILLNKFAHGAIDLLRPPFGPHRSGLGGTDGTVSLQDLIYALTTHAVAFRQLRSRHTLAIEAHDLIVTFSSRPPRHSSPSSR